MQLEGEECSERTAGAIRGNRRALDRGFGLTGRWPFRRGGAAAERESCWRVPVRGEAGLEHGLSAAPPTPHQPRGTPAPRKGDAGLCASKRSRYPQRGRRCEGEHSRLRALNPRAPPIQKGTVGPPPIRSEGRGMRPEVLLWCCSLHTETGRVGSKCSHPAPVPGGTHGKPADWFPGGREVGQWPPG